MQETDQLSAWECSGELPYWQEHSTVLNHTLTCFICGRPRPDIEVPQQLRLVFSPKVEVVGMQRVDAQPPKREPPQPPPPLPSRRWIPKRLSPALLLAIFLVGGGLLWKSIGSSQSAMPVSANPDTLAAPMVESERYSRGERRLLRYLSNPDAERGTEAFALGDYRKAQVYFERAIRGEYRNPEIQIYLSNAKARQAQAQPFTLAIVVPVEAALSSAEELLRGVADAQTQFNQSGGMNGRLLEIVIANDDGDPTIAPRVAKTLAANSEILGVIGHPTSATTQVALAIYDKANLPVISATSDSTFLSDRVFFRTLSSVQVSSASLAEHARKRLGLERVAVFYNPQDSYSTSCQEEFVKKFKELGGQSVELIDLSRSDFQPDEQVKALQGKFDTIALFPDSRSVTTSFSIAEANKELPREQRMQLLGGNSLYRPQTLATTKNTAEGLILAIPWVAQTPYAQRANQRWGGQISWRTAMSYDATQAFVNALSNDASRTSVLSDLRQVYLLPNQTAGDTLQFTPTGDRIGKPILVQVARGAGGPTGSQFIFKKID